MVARDDRQQDFRAIEDVLHEELEKLHRLSIEGTSLTGTPSGFKDLDEITGGFQPGNLIIIAARPAMGKSALVCNIAENAAVTHGKPVALFSLEMARPSSRSASSHRRRGSRARSFRKGPRRRASAGRRSSTRHRCSRRLRWGRRLERRRHARDPRQGATPAQPVRGWARADQSSTTCS